MQKKDPEGYRKLLAYQKASELQIFTNEFVRHLPKTKTFFDLADQTCPAPIPLRQNSVNYSHCCKYLFTKRTILGELGRGEGRSGRSGSKNIVEGWKRNTTKEYFDFLGFSIGAVEELKDDAADIATGVYPGLMGLKGKMGEMGGKGKMGEMEPPSALFHHQSHFSPSTPYPHSAPLIPLVPLQPFPRADLDKLKFYPLDFGLPIVVQLFLRAKELNFLLYKLQQSLDIKMDSEGSKPLNQKIQNYFNEQKQADKDMEEYIKSLGLKRLENGQYVEEEKGE